MSGRRILLAAAAALAALASTGTAPAAAASAKCVGAAALDAKRPCTNTSRRFTPSLAKADLVTSSPCKLLREKPEPVCTFGASASRAKKHVALVGDSHALQWRSALDFVASSQRWQGFSVTAPGCPFSDAVKYLAEGIRAPCVEWYHAVLKWFRHHPEITTVFVSQFAPMPLNLPPGKTELQVKSAGFRRAWSRLPKTVKRIVAIRDTPMTTDGTAPCLREALAAAASPGEACRLPRADVVKQDAAVVTARQLRSKRYGVADLTSFFCDRAFCFPVVGGLLVYRDTFGHITLDYARSLGPYLLRRLRFLGLVR
jgi:hypothetical protein